MKHFISKPKSTFYKDYSVPIKGTATFLVIVFIMLFGRYFELASLRTFSNEVTKKANDFGLISRDKAKLNSDDDNSTNYQTATNSNSQSNQSSTTSENQSSNESSTTESTSNQSSSNDTNDPPPDDPPPDDPPPDDPPPDDPPPDDPPPDDPPPSMQIEIKEVKHYFTTTQEPCGAWFSFRSKVRVYNGPGEFTYFFIYKTPNGEEKQTEKKQFYAQPGVNDYTINAGVSMYANHPFDGYVHFIIESPVMKYRTHNYTYECSGSGGPTS